jgi:hypothetical protein
MASSGSRSTSRPAVGASPWLSSVTAETTGDHSESPLFPGTLHDRLESARRHQRDEIHSAHDLELEEATGFLRTPTGPHRLKAPARRLLAQRLRIPDSYLGRPWHSFGPST